MSKKIVNDNCKEKAKKRRIKAGPTPRGYALLFVIVLPVYFFLYAPMVIMVAYSFNASRFQAVWQGFTLDWYYKLLHNETILLAARNSLIVALASTIISTVIGTMTAFALHKYKFPGKNLFKGIIYIPIVIPDIVMGVSLLAFYILLGFTLGLHTIVIAHVAFSISFVALVVRARLYGINPALHDAAKDLGAGPGEIFRRITWPLIKPGVLAGALLAFTISLDDFIITFFTAGVGSTTLPLKIYSMVKFGVTPEINALSTIILLFIIVAVFLAQKLSKKSYS